ncbi:MAG: beta strand repeat-containing protein [Planctomycetota bacterium]
MFRRVVCTGLAAFASLLAFSRAPLAADVSWTAGSGNYDLGSNWSTGTVPTATDVAVISNGGVPTLTLSGSTTGATLAVGQNGAGSMVIAGSGTHSIGGGSLIGYTTASSAVPGVGSLSIGSGATLRIDGGNGSTVVGSGAGALGASGTLSVASGGNLIFNGGSGRNLVIADTVNGNSSSALLDISGTVTVAGEFVVALGRASTAGGVGTATGTVTINAGGLLSTNDWTKFAPDVYNGPNTGGIARLNMNGGTFDKLGGGALVFGNYIGTADVVHTGGTVNVAGSSDGLYIGAWGTLGVGSYTLSSGTVLVSSGNLAVGKSAGQGTFTMTGGLVQKTSPQDFQIGEGGASNGTMTVTGGLVDIPAGDLAIGVWGGNGSLTIGGSGTVRAGNVVFSKNAATALSTLTLNAGGRLEASRITSVNPLGVSIVSFNGGRLVATGDQTAFMSGLTNASIDAGGATIDTQGYAVTMSQPLSGAGALTKLGSGTLAMTGAGSFSGPTTVAAGGLGLTTAHTGGNAVTVAAGATLGVTVSGSINTQLTLSSLGLGNGSGLTIDLASFGNPTLAPLNVLGGITTSGASTVLNFATGSPSAGTIPLVAYGSLSSYNFTLGTLPAGMSASLVNNTGAKTIDLVISSIPIRRWQGNVSAAWNTTTANWVSTFTGTGPSAVFTNGDGPVLFTDEATGPTAVTLNTNVTTVATQFTNNVLTYSLSGTGAIGGTGGLTKSGSANVTIGTRNTYTGVTRLEGGTTSISVLANGGTASGIGAASAAASNLVFAGGRLEYTGSSVTVNRGFSLSGDGGGITVTQSNALLSTSGTVTASSGRFTKGGPGHLRITGTSNVLGNVSDGAGFVVESGSMTLAGASPANPTAQINTVTGDVQIGGLADTPVSFTMTNSTLNLSGWLSLGHETGTAGSTTALTRAAVSAGNFRMGYAAIANSGSHSLTINNSNVAITGEALIGNIGPSIGTLSIQGTSAFRAGSDMNVGNTVGTQGAVAVGGTTTMTVLGRLRVGDLGTGSVAATGSTRLLLNQVQIGNGATATGTMTMDADASATLTGYIAVGNAGTGLLAMSGRSRMDVQYDLNVADLGGALGTMTLADRATATGGSVFLGKGFTSSGTVTITGGTLSQTNASGEFIVGRDGDGILTISGSGRVVASATTGMLLGAAASSAQATVNLNGGVLEVRRIRKGDGATGVLNVNSGTLRAGSGAVSDFVTGSTTVNVLAGGATIDTNGQNVTIAATLANGGGAGGLTKRGSGTLTLSASNGITGTTTIQQGRVQLANASALTTSRVVPLAGGTASLSPYLVASVAGLAPNAGGLTDVSNGALTVLSGLSATDLVTALVAGRNGGSWDGTSGITSSVSAAQVAASELRAVGWLDNGDGSVTTAYAAPGDTNLDWVVDILDVSNFVAGGKYGTIDPASWTEGDFNYDGIVDIQDVADFAATGLYGAASYNVPPPSVGAVAAVPEPATALNVVGLAALAAAGHAMRRRHGRGA